MYLLQLHIILNYSYHRPHTNSRKTGQQWWDFYDQETMNLTYEMYHMDFEVFGYDLFIKQRSDLVPPKRSRNVILKSNKFDSFSRNSLVGFDGLRMSQQSLFSSVKSSVRSDAESARKIHTLKQSLIEGNKDELLGAFIGFRSFSEVTEVDEHKLD